MTKLRATRCALLVFACWGVAVDAHAENLLQDLNYSFETQPNDPKRPQQPVVAGGVQIMAPWRVVGVGQVDIYQCPAAAGVSGTTHGIPAINYCDAGERNQYLSLSTQGSKAKVLQTVQTEKNQRYRVRFMLAGAKDVNFAAFIPTVLVDVSDGGSGDGTNLATQMYAPFPNHLGANPTQMNHALVWKDEEFYFRAASDSTTITFFANPNLSVADASFIDNVRLEPSGSGSEISLFFSLGLVSIGLALGLALGYFISRKRGRGVQARG